MVFRRRSAARSVGIEKKEALSWELGDYSISLRALWNVPRSVRYSANLWKNEFMR